MKLLYLFFLAMLFMNLACPLTSLAGGEVIDGVYYSEQALEKMRLLQKLQEAINDPSYEPQESDSFTGYGRVVDQDGDPVANANVEAQWWRNEVVVGVGFKTHTDEMWVVTDQDGYFSVTTPNGAIPTFNKVNAKGYEARWDLTTYNNAGSAQDEMMKNSANEPIIIYMRKLNPTTFLLKSEVGFYFKESSTTLRYTMIPGLLRKIDSDLTKLRKPEQNDLIFDVNKNNDGSFTMHIQPVPKMDSSMQLLDEFLYAAPADGYGQEVTLTIMPEDNEINKYLYFTSRNPGVYSRMEMQLRIRDEGDLEFHSSTWTNPYGKRNLEWEPELPSRLETILFEEAESALLDGRLAQEPVSLQALIEQYTSD